MRGRHDKGYERCEGRTHRCGCRRAQEGGPGRDRDPNAPAGLRAGKCARGTPSLENSRNGRALRERSGGQPSGTERRPSRRFFRLSGAAQAAPEPNDQQVNLTGQKRPAAASDLVWVLRFGCGLTFSRVVWVRIFISREITCWLGARADVFMLYGYLYIMLDAIKYI